MPSIWAGGWVHVEPRGALSHPHSQDPKLDSESNQDRGRPCKRGPKTTFRAVDLRRSGALDTVQFS